MLTKDFICETFSSETEGCCRDTRNTPGTDTGMPQRIFLRIHKPKLRHFDLLRICYCFGFNALIQWVAALKEAIWGHGLLILGLATPFGEVWPNAGSTDSLRAFSENVPTPDELNVWPSVRLSQ